LAALHVTTTGRVLALVTESDGSATLSMIKERGGERLHYWPAPDPTFFLNTLAELDGRLLVGGTRANAAIVLSAPIEVVVPPIPPIEVLVPPLHPIDVVVAPLPLSDAAMTGSSTTAAPSTASTARLATSSPSTTAG
jgi:hypothetical protein